MNRTHLALLSLAAALVAAPAAFAHEAAKGKNGGLRVDAGKYHAELVVDGTSAVAVFLSDADDKPIPTAGFKANAILVIDGKSQRFELVPADGSKLTGTAPAPVNPGAKGAIQITAPDGTTAQAKY
ncbi:MAG: hypothetical protein JNM89_11125 [Hyphomicrobiaceae bacterium]|nr:hypothetical protein [Hyphomicrobiaceae bacterium]